MTTREALIRSAEERDDVDGAAHLRAMTDEQVDAVLASLAKWAKEVTVLAEQMYANAAKSFAPLVAIAQKYAETP